MIFKKFGNRVRDQIKDAVESRGIVISVLLLVCFLFMGATMTRGLINTLADNFTAQKITSSTTGINGGFWTANGYVKIRELGSAGNIRIAESGGDSMCVKIDGSTVDFISNNLIRFMGQGGPSYFRIGNSNITPSTTDTYGMGATGTRFLNGYFTDLIDIGGKGQSAKIRLGTMNTTTEETDSCVVIDGSTQSIKIASSTGLVLRFLGVRPAAYVATLGDLWISRNGGTTPRDSLIAKVTADSVAYLVFTARAKAHN